MWSGCGFADDSGRSLHRAEDFLRPLIPSTCGPSALSVRLRESSLHLGFRQRWAKMTTVHSPSAVSPIFSFSIWRCVASGEDTWCCPQKVQHQELDFGVVVLLGSGGDDMGVLNSRKPLTPQAATHRARADELAMCVGHVRFTLALRLKPIRCDMARVRQVIRNKTRRKLKFHFRRQVVCDNAIGRERATRNKVSAYDRFL